MCGETTNLYRETDITSEIGKGRSRSLGHVERMSEKRSVKKVFNNTPEGRRTVGKLREND